MSDELYWKIRYAEQREMRDDHLSPSEREEIVNQFRAERPSAKLPADLDDAFVDIVMP
jgi:hypothetical protein